MGLGGRKVKQRIGHDPRNLSWADDAAKFGQAYLSKFGWNPSEGLGVQGDGRISHIKVAQKLDMLGIGAGAQKGAEGVAWKQNRDYEILLRRLNAGGGEEAVKSVPESMGFEQARNDGEKEEQGDNAEEGDQEEVAEETKKERKRRKKLEKEARAREAEEAEASAKTKKKKRKTASAEDGHDASPKKRKRNKDETEATSSSGSATPADVVPPASETPSVDASPAPSRPPRPMAHRARFRASKRMTALSSSAMSEILGISPSISSATTPYSTHSPSPAPFSQSTPNLPSATTTSNEAPKLEILTSATKSVADYFQEKLAAKGTSSGSKTETKREEDEMPDDEDDYKPRFGMGMGARRMQMAAIGIS